MTHGNHQPPQQRKPAQESSNAGVTSEPGRDVRDGTATRVLVDLREFIGPNQRHAIKQACQGEEREFFLNKLEALAELIRTMAQTYDQDGKGDQATAYLHYYRGGCDWYITEKDRAGAQLQAFGQADLGYGPELGYISLVELLACGVELDLHFTPCTLADLAREREARAAGFGCVAAMADPGFMGRLVAHSEAFAEELGRAESGETPAFARAFNLLDKE